MSKESAMQMATGVAQVPSGEGTAPALTAPIGTNGPIPPGEGSSQQAPTEQLESTRFALLAKKEAELQRQRDSFKKEQTQFMTERQKTEAIQKQLNEFNELKMKDPVQALKNLGFSEADLFNFIAAQEDKSTPEERAAKAAQAEIQKFQDQQAKEKADAQKAQDTQVLGQFRKDISATIEANPDKYEYCKFNGPLAEDLIYETVAAVVQSEGIVISTQEAADMVEQWYEDQDKEMMTLKKRQPKQEVAPVADAPLKPQVSPRPAAARALASKANASVASTVPKPLNESPDQKKARLIAKYLGPKQ